MRMATLARDALENTLNFLFTKVVVHVLLPERHDVEAATRVVRAHAARFFSSSEGPGRVPLGLRGLVSLLLMLALSGLPLALVAFSPAAWFPSISIASIRKLVRRPYRATDLGHSIWRNGSGEVACSDREPPRWRTDNRLRFDPMWNAPPNASACAGRDETAPRQCACGL